MVENTIDLFSDPFKRIVAEPLSWTVPAGLAGEVMLRQGSRLLAQGEKELGGILYTLGLLTVSYPLVGTVSGLLALKLFRQENNLKINFVRYIISPEHISKE